MANKSIRVLGYVLMSAGTVNAKFQSGASGTDLTGAFPLVAQAGISAALAPVNAGGRHDCWFETVAGALLNLNLDAGTLVVGHVTYEVI